jgi:signal transduction histidine kinase
MKLGDEICRRYAAELDHLLSSAGEEALTAAYELGRLARAEGRGILDIVALHHEATQRLLRSGTPGMEPAEVLEKASSLLSEALTPFEMTYRAVDEANTALRRLNELLEGEAERIAHALHDQAASIVASATLELDLVLGDLPQGAREQLLRVRQLLDETGDHLRQLSHELRPTILDDLGLQAALTFLAEGFEKRTGVRVYVRGTVRERFPSAVETAFYRVVQEALNNAFAHAGESLTVTVAIDRLERGLRCVITDDGAGFDVTAVLGAKAKQGLGLLGMRERVSAVGGVCDVWSVPGHGTSVEVVVPIDRFEPEAKTT